MTRPPTRVAVVGTGLLGAPVAANLARHGFAVSVWNRTAEKAESLREHGCDAHSQLADALAGVDAVITLLSDGTATEEVLTGPLRALENMPPGSLLIQSGTIGADATVRIAAAASAVGVEMVDAPVSGSREPAERGELIILAGGAATARRLAQPIFDAMGKRTHWVGDVGAGSRLKLVIQTWLVCLLESLAETISVAEHVGIDPQDFLEAIADGPLDVPYAQLKGAAMIDRRFDPAFALRLLPKDTRLAAEMLGGDAAQVAPMLDLVLERAAAAIAMGHGESDMAAIFYASGRS
jgi:3-hydroxyisobutyrate dehydrogenase